MEIYPAIDIKRGRAVRYAGGGPDTVYPTDPMAAAEAFATQGARWLHVVDLDRAFDTGGDNDALVRRIAGIRELRLQLGGRLRGPDHVARALELGAARAVVATGAATDPRVWDSIAAAVEPSRLAVAVDVRAGRLAQRGSDWPVPVDPEGLVRSAVAAGVRTVIHRDLDKDGELAGADIDGAAHLIGLGADVIVAGGVGSAAHLLAARAAGLAGAVVGRALHEGRLTVREALACLA